MGHREHLLHLSDEEQRQMLAELREVVRARAGHSPGPGRAPHLFATVSMPVDRPAGETS